MIGPLVVTAAVFMGPAPRIAVPTALRPVGQAVVATQVGLAFSPAALSLLVDLAPVIVGSALATGLCILAVANLVSRLTGQPLAQAFLSAVPTSPVEAAAIAIAAGIAPMPVIFSQTLRLSTVVLIVPFALFAVEGWPDIERPSVSLDVGSPANVPVLAAIGAAGALAFRRLRVPNPYFLGPLTMAAALAASDVAPLPYQPVFLAMAQIILGT